MLALGAPGRGPSPFVVAERHRACDERRTASAIRFRSSRVATPPVGLCGEFKKIARGDASSDRNASMAAMLGRKPSACLSGVSTARAPRRSMFGTKVGKYGLNTSTPSPGFKKASQKNC